MQKYINNVTNTFGIPVAGASVLVSKLAGGFATLYSDNGITPTANPVSTNGVGQFSFYAPDGRYSLTISGSGISPYTVSDILLEDPAGGGSGGAFTSLSVTGVITSTVATGTAPLVVASTTPVANLTAATCTTIPALSGDVTSVANAVTLATVNTTVGTYGSASSVATVTLDGKGRVTTASSVPIAIANTAVSGLGTMSTQAANAVAITGGAIDGTALGTTTASSARITTLKVAEGTNAKQGTATLVAAISAPTQNAGSTSITGGTLAAQIYFYKVTALNAQGETVGSNEQSITTSNLSVPTANTPTTATTGGTLAAATYYYKVTALGSTGETTPSNEVSITTTGTTSTVTVTWSAITGATGYKLYRGTAAGGENVYYSTGNVTSYTDTGAASTAGTPPVGNQAVTATNSNVVNWTAVTGATGYKIYRGTASGAENVFYQVGVVTTYTDTGAASTGGTVPTANTTNGAFVANTSTTAVSRIQLTSQSDGGTPGFLRVFARTPGTSFTIVSSSTTDTSTVAYLMTEPA